MASRLDHDDALRIAGDIIRRRPDILATDARGGFIHWGDREFQLYEACNRVAGAYACNERASRADLRLVRHR